MMLDLNVKEKEKQVDAPLQFVLELRHHNFRSQREPRNFDELVRAAQSL